MNLEFYLLVGGVVLLALLLATFTLILPLRAQLRARNNTSEGDTSPSDSTRSEGVHSHRERTMTLALTTLILIGFFLWDQFYNTGVVRGAVIAQPLIAVWALVTAIAAMWCSVNFLVEPTSWAKHIGAVIVISLAASGVIPVAILIFGQGWFSDLIDTVQTFDWTILQEIRIEYLIPIPILLGLAAWLWPKPKGKN